MKTAHEMLTPLSEDMQIKVIRNAVDLMNWAARNHVSGELTFDEAVREQIKLLADMDDDRDEAEDMLREMAKASGITELAPRNQWRGLHSTSR